MRRFVVTTAAQPAHALYIPLPWRRPATLGTANFLRATHPYIDSKRGRVQPVPHDSSKTSLPAMPASGSHLSLISPISRNSFSSGSSSSPSSFPPAASSSSLPASEPDPSASACLASSCCRSFLTSSRLHEGETTGGQLGSYISLRRTNICKSLPCISPVSL